MFRAEQMLTLERPDPARRGGGQAAGWSTRAELELRDAILIDVGGAGRAAERWLGTIAAGATVAIDGPARPAAARTRRAGPGPDPNPFLDELRTTWEPREENQGELRLVAWVAGTDPAAR